MTDYIQIEKSQKINKDRQTKGKRFSFGILPYIKASLKISLYT